MTMPKYKGLYQFLMILFLAPVLAFAVWCGYDIHKLSQERAVIKKDYSQINNIQHGLLSVDAWKGNLMDIINTQINEFQFTNKQEDTLRVELNKILNSLVTKAVTMVNKKQTTLKGKVTKFAVNNFIEIDKVREKVPEFTNTIIAEVKKPQSKERLKYLAQDKIKEFASETHDSISSSNELIFLLVKYNAADIPTFNKQVSVTIDALQEQIYLRTFALIACLSLLLLLWLIFRNKKFLYTPLFTMSVLLALVVLLVGLLAPMIEIDARIKELNFELIGKHLVFNDQVIFYQSKSILDVVHILVTEGKTDAIFVGILILIFSVLFPIVKLLSTKIYLLGNDKWKKNSFIKFFAFKSGKWSMADVMVVAIFMAYIGFKGILDNQMSHLNMKTKSLATIATNETSLQPGFILFIAYVIFGLILGVILKKITSDVPLGSKLKVYAKRFKFNAKKMELKPIDNPDLNKKD
jgi:hypothetical protein